MNLIFDLDGTLIDASERMYRLFNRLIPESSLTKMEYWDLKRAKVNHQMLLQRFFPQYNFDVFNRKWLSMIELDDYLDMDICYPDTISVLERLSEDNSIILLTARQDKERLLAELARLKIKKYFKLILVTEAKLGKKELVLEAVKAGRLPKLETTVLFISDMGKDILCGKELGVKTVGITHGFMSREKLLGYEPDYLVDELREVEKIVAVRNKDNQ